MSATVLCPEPIQLRPDLSLGQLLTRAHEEAREHGTGDCPVCGGTLAPRAAAASCDDCGARLF